jgi:hypothetical protein
MSPEIIHTVVCAGCLLALAVVTYRIRQGMFAAIRSRTKVSRRGRFSVPFRTK